MDLDTFQDRITTRYGDADRQRGLPASVAWLTEEVGELAQSIRRGGVDAQVRELGDVLAWLASIADQLGIRLSDAARNQLDAERPPTDPEAHRP